MKAARAEQNAPIAACDLDRVASLWTDSVTVSAGETARPGRYRRAFETGASMRYERTPQQVVSPTWPVARQQGTSPSTRPDRRRADR